MIRSLLIANRGEIACRIIRTCRQLGIRSVVVFSEADADSLAVQLADTAVYIGPSPTIESYLNISAIIEAAKRTKADAIHPGFGFLAENSEFAQACVDAGLIFVGPPANAIEAMGNKRAAKTLVAEAGVPVISGYSGVAQEDETLLAEADEIGYPLMVKAAAGGGGKGMRVVYKADELPEALLSARREAKQAFGSDELILERALLKPRHVEIQVFGDAHGNIIYLGERECSIQRRQQKVIEESPSVVVRAELRAKMGETAVHAAQTVNYQNAGTVEFLLDETGEFYFLEMNTRLQVEHPVTELVTGIDLVEWQIRVAEGEPLPLTQEEIELKGHAIEARVYAENPANDFLPVTGDILLWRPPTDDGIRVDDGIQTGDQVSVFYDPMLAKIIAHGPDRKTAVRRLIRALENAMLLGLAHNISFLCEVLRHPEFIAGDVSTHFLADHFADWEDAVGDVALAVTAVSLIQFRQHPQLEQSQGYWRNNPNQPMPYRYLVGGQEIDCWLQPKMRQSEHFSARTEAGETAVQLHEIALPDVIVTVAGVRQQVTAVSQQNDWWIKTDAGSVYLQSIPLLPEPQTAVDAGGTLRAPMPGSVLDVLVEVGQTVAAGQALMKLEAMKMEHTIRTSGAGIVEAIYYKVGDTVEADTQLLKIRSVD